MHRTPPTRPTSTTALVTPTTHRRATFSTLGIAAAFGIALLAGTTAAADNPRYQQVGDRPHAKPLTIQRTVLRHHNTESAAHKKPAATRTATHPATKTVTTRTLTPKTQPRVQTVHHHHHFKKDRYDRRHHNHHTHKQGWRFKHTYRDPYNHRPFRHIAPRRHWTPGYWTKQYIPPVYSWRYHHCGTRYRVIVRHGYHKNVWVPGRWITTHHRNYH